MPFINQVKRFKFERGDMFLMDYGDRCYVPYKKMVDEWRKEPRWSTAHKIYMGLTRMPIGEMNEDDWVAAQLAWQVFFQLHVMPYELKKREENGDV